MAFLVLCRLLPGRGIAHTALCRPVSCRLQNRCAPHAIKHESCRPDTCVRSFETTDLSRGNPEWRTDHKHHDVAYERSPAGDREGRLDNVRWSRRHAMAPGRHVCPSLVAGFTFRKLGAGASLVIGIVLTLLAVLVGMHSAHHLSGYYWALALLGVGWNISFVTSSILLSHGEDLHLRRSAQTASETLRYFFSSAASLIAAAALEYSGWYGLNIAMLPLLLIGIVSCGWWLITTKVKTRQRNSQPDYK